MDEVVTTKHSLHTTKKTSNRVSEYPGRTPELAGWASFQGIKAHAAGYAVDNMGQVIWLYVGGPQQAVRSLWASLAGGGALEIDQTPVRFERETSYVRVEAQMGMTRLYSTSLLHPQASLLFMQPGKDCFYLLSQTPETVPLRLFFRMLNKALALPLAPDWTEYLWKAGTQMHFTDRTEKRGENIPAPRERLITALKSKACGGWRVLTDLAYWMLVVEFGLKQGMIR